MTSLSYYVGLQGTIHQARLNNEGGYYFDILAITALSQGHLCPHPLRKHDTTIIALNQTAIATATAAANAGLSLVLL